MGVRLAVRVERRRPPSGHEREVGDDVLGAGRLGVVDDVGRIGLGREQRRKDLRVQLPPCGNRDARPDRVAGELMAEADVARVHLEQRPALGLLRRRRPAGQDGVEHRRGDAVRHHRDELDQPPLLLRQPRDAAADSIRDRARQLVRRARGEQLGDVERVASGRGVDVLGRVPGERSDRARGQRPELDDDRGGGHGRVHRVARRRLAVPAREEEHHGQRADSPREQGDHVERRLVGPVHVLEHEHRRLRWEDELVEQQPVDRVR